MLTKITHITILVNNQDEALKFYKKIGFELNTDAMFEECRWLTINLPEQKNIEVALMPAQTKEEKELVGKQGGSRPILNIETDDCQKDYERLLQLGIQFTEKPQMQPWGLSVSFKDLYGNILYLCQTKK